MKIRLTRKELLSTDINFSKLSEDELIDYINVNVKKARYKIKYFTQTGYYRVSQEYKDATYALNIFNRKYGIADNRITGSKRFLSSKTVGVSKADLKYLARSIQSLINIHTKDVSKLYRKVVAKYANAGVTFEEAYEILSKLGKEFREIYSLLSYSETSTLIQNGNVTSVEEILSVFYERLQDKVPTDKQQYHINNLRDKIIDRYDSRTLSSIFGEDF